MVQVASIPVVAVRAKQFEKTFGKNISNLETQHSAEMFKYPHPEIKGKTFSQVQTDLMWGSTPQHRGKEKRFPSIGEVVYFLKEKGKELDLSKTHNFIVIQNGWKKLISTKFENNCWKVDFVSLDTCHSKITDQEILWVKKYEPEKNKKH